MNDELIEAQVVAIRIACRQMTAVHLKALHDSVEQACRIPGDFPWERKAAAHAEIFNVLADAAHGPLPAPMLSGGVGLAYELMVATGRAAGGMIASSRRRLLAHLRAGDSEGAALEMERHLQALYYMWRLATCAAHRKSALFRVRCANPQPERHASPIVTLPRYGLRQRSSVSLRRTRRPARWRLARSLWFAAVDEQSPTRVTSTGNHRNDFRPSRRSKHPATGPASNRAGRRAHVDVLVNNAGERGPRSRCQPSALTMWGWFQRKTLGGCARPGTGGPPSVGAAGRRVRPALRRGRHPAPDDVIGLHERISGRPSRVRVLNRILTGMTMEVGTRRL
jgi:hypothetical protein